ncbi:EAL domain-containing protein (putative c-di-GMP-specific phosphodiesterase class I) [Bacillus fengqiuensis]|nr:EAL domain-containing protein (putative c-di-GMP-specific phosphodiesterase class I) [Bacillus fengqiuensis]
MDMILTEEKTLSERRVFQSILKYKKIHTLFQPIISLNNGCPHGYEALSRGPAGTVFHSPLQLFSYAEKEGCLYLLEKLSRELALKTATPLLADNEKIFINISAQVIYDSNFTPGHTLSLLNEYGFSPEQVVFEITERSAIHDFDAFREVLYHYRKQGFKIAIDDAGAGYSSLQAITELMPDYIKVDRSLIQHIDKKEVKQNIVEAFVTFAKKTNAALVAEGIETKEELKKVISLGIHYAQGFILSRPSNPIQQVPYDVVHTIQSANFHRHSRKKITITEHDDLIILKDGNPILETNAKNILTAYQQLYR